MTGHELLRRRARKLVVIGSAQLLLLLVAWVLFDPLGVMSWAAYDERLLLYCRMLLAGLVIASLVLRARALSSLRCPWCKFDFAAQSAFAFSFPSNGNRINFCPHCRQSLDESLPNLRQRE